MKSEILQKQLNEIEQHIDNLKQKRVAWIKDNKQTIENARLIVVNLGSRTETSYRYPWNQCPIYEFSKDEIKIRLITGLGNKWLPSKNEFEKTESMLIMFGDYRVCYYHFSNNPNTDRSNDLFIPGNWSQYIDELIEQAKTIDLSYRIEQKKRAKKQIETLLLIGENL